MARRVAEALSADDDLELDPRDPPDATRQDLPRDADLADDELEDDDQQDDEGDDTQDAAANRDDPEPRRRRAPARDDDRFTRLETELRETRARAEAAERLAQDASTRFQQRQEPVETPEQEAAKLALMTPAEMVRYNQSKVEAALGRHTSVIQQMTLQANIGADKAAFEAKYANHPSMKALVPEVEKRFADLAAKGQYPTRETVLTYVLGERAMKAMQSPEARRGDRERQQRVDRQRTEQRGGGSDVRQDRRGGGRTAADRLANVQI